MIWIFAYLNIELSASEISWGISISTVNCWELTWNIFEFVFARIEHIFVTWAQKVAWAISYL